MGSSLEWMVFICRRSMSGHGTVGDGHCAVVFNKSKSIGTEFRNYISISQYNLDPNILSLEVMARKYSKSLRIRNSRKGGIPRSFIHPLLESWYWIRWMTWKKYFFKLILCTSKETSRKPVFADHMIFLMRMWYAKQNTLFGHYVMTALTLATESSWER